MPSDVLDNEPQTPEVDDKSQGKSGKTKDDTISLTKAEYEALKRERDEARESERFWAERAKGGKPADPEMEADDEPEIDTSDLLPKGGTGDDDLDEALLKDPDKWVDAVSKGPQAVEALIKRTARSLGLVSGAEAAEIAAKVAKRTVAHERQKITTDSQLITDFPDLKDRNSELWQETAKRFRKAVALDPNAEKSPAALYMAAEAAKEFLASKKAPKPKHEDDDDPYDRYDRNEKDRRARIAAQDGRRRPDADDEDDSDLGPQARELVKAFGLEEKDYVAARQRVNGRQR